MGSPKLFKIIDGMQKAFRYAYVVLILLMLYASLYGYLTESVAWIDPTIKVVSAVELFLVVTFFGLRIAKSTFSKIDGDVLGTEIVHIVQYWEWLEDKIKDMLIYNGIIGFVILNTLM